MAGRTFAIGDIHGELDSLFALLSRFPTLDADDTLVFLGDYVDGGPRSAEVVDYLRRLPAETQAKVVTLRGNHEDCWLRVVHEGFAEFLLPSGNGCLATFRSYRPGLAAESLTDLPKEDLAAFLRGTFVPKEHVDWMLGLPVFYEDEHAIYVHAGLPKGKDGWEHPSETSQPAKLMWCRDKKFVEGYRGKLVVFGHTMTKYLPPELSDYTPDDPTDAFKGPCVIGLDTGSGKGGFLSGLELPAMRVYESR